MTAALRDYIRYERNVRAREAQRAYDEVEIAMGERKCIAVNRKLDIPGARRQARRAARQLEGAAR